jgi:hypothetical protein
MSYCTDTIPSNCVPWNGPSIPCLGLCKGDNVSEVIVKLATKICEVAEPYDLSTLNLQCALDIFDNDEPSSRTIATVLQLLLDNDCGLKELIDNLQAQITGLGETTFVVDLKCLAEFDSFGNPLPYTEETVIQGLINEICAIKTTVAYLSGKVVDLQNQIDNIELNPVINEPSITTCVNPNLLPASTQIKNTSTELCNYKNIVGPSSDVATALSRICPDWNTKFQTEPGWIPAPINFMQQMNNFFIAFCNILGRVETIEGTCCAPSCSDIEIGFSIEVVDDQIIIRFRDLDGTNIPAGWVNNGSTMTITDPLTGDTTTFSIPLAQNYETETISLSGFTPGNTLVFTLQANMKNGSYTCAKLVTKTWKYTTNTCCVITNIGEGSATIFYQTNTSGGS